MRSSFQQNQENNSFLKYGMLRKSGIDCFAGIKSACGNEHSTQNPLETHLRWLQMKQCVSMEKLNLHCKNNAKVTFLMKN